MSGTNTDDIARLYVITVQGEVASVAMLTPEQAAKIEGQIEAEPFIRGSVVTADVATSLYATEVEVEAAIDAWRL